MKSLWITLFIAMVLCISAWGGYAAFEKYQESQIAELRDENSEQHQQILESIETVLDTIQKYHN